MAKNFNSSALPEHCYAVLPGSGQLIEVRRGEKGYYPCAYSTSDREYNKVLANYFNAHEGISKAQAAAMLAGSMFGWNVPAADPACYDAEGIPIQPGEKKAPTRSPEYQYEQAKLIRQNYQPGTKVVLDEKMEDPYREMPAGLTGIVDSVDDLGQIHCHWENGSSLALIPGVDPAGQGRYAHPVEADIGHGGKQAFQHNAPLLVAGSLAGQVQGQADQCPGEVILGVGDGSGLAADACPAGTACAPGRLFTLEAKHFICH